MNTPGIFLIDKPAGLTSHDVVNVVRRLTGEKRVGHAGTLDPFATGLLIVLVGREATREQQRFLGLDKTYHTTLKLGQTSTTHDPEGTITDSSSKEITQEQFRSVLNEFIGTFEQMPPQFSAKKVGGKKAYELARKGERALLTPKEITIHTLKLLAYHWPSAELETNVSSGTYIRALARDIGKKLTVGSYLTALRRMAIGSFTIKDAQALKTFTTANLIPLPEALAILDKKPTA